MNAVSHRPTPLASGLAILLAAGGTALLTHTVAQGLVLVGTVVGTGLVVMGGHTNWRRAGIKPVLTLAGAATLLAAFGWGLSLPETGSRVELLPGMAGTVMIGLGVRPLSDRLARRFVSAGLAALVIGVMLVGVFESAGPLRLLSAAVAAIAAWDIAEHGISLGEQLRTDAATGTVELLHGGATIAFGGVLAFVSILLFNYGPTGLSLGALVLLLAAAVTLLALLYK